MIEMSLSLSLSRFVSFSFSQPDIEEAPQQIPMPPEMVSFPNTTDDGRSETASSGYASIQGTEQHSPVEEDTAHSSPGNAEARWSLMQTRT